jgi:hypothetical protein
MDHWKDNNRKEMKDAGKAYTTRKGKQVQSVYKSR